MSAHLERESGPLRFVVHAVSLHRHHMDELDIPLPRRAHDEARDALCIAPRPNFWNPRGIACSPGDHELLGKWLTIHETPERDRKSTRLNSSHTVISYAVFCLKKKKQ